MDNISPVNPSDIPPINPPSDSSNSYTPGQRALLDAMAAFYADLQAALKQNPPDLSKLQADGKKFEQLFIAYVSVFGSKDPIVTALEQVGDGTDGSGGYFQDLIAACGMGDKGTISSDFSAIQGSQDIQNQIQNSLNTLYQSFPLPPSRYDATEQAFLDLTGFLQQILSANPNPNSIPIQGAIQNICQNLAILQTDLQSGNAAEQGMYNTFVNDAPGLLTQLIQDGSSGNDLSGDIQAIENSWSTVNAAINKFLNIYP